MVIAKHVAAYGGEDALGRDVTFLRRFKHALAFACLGCLAGAPSQLAAFAEVPCGALRPTCVDLRRGVDSNPRSSRPDSRAGAIAMRRRDDAARSKGRHVDVDLVAVLLADNVADDAAKEADEQSL